MLAFRERGGSSARSSNKAGKELRIINYVGHVEVAGSCLPASARRYSASTAR